MFGEDGFATEPVTVSAHADTGRAVTWSPDGTLLATTGDDSYLRLWDATTNQQLWQSSIEQGIFSARWNPDGRTIATTSTDQPHIVLWDAQSGQKARTLELGHPNLRQLSIDWNPEGTLLASAGNDRQVRVWSAADGTLLATLGQGTNTWRSVDWSPSGNALLSAGFDGTLIVWGVPQE